MKWTFDFITGGTDHEAPSGGSHAMRSYGSSVINRMGDQQVRWKRQVIEQRRNIYDRHSMLNWGRRRKKDCDEEEDTRSVIYKGHRKVETCQEAALIKLERKYPYFICRVTKQLEPNIPLTSKQMFRFGLACPGQAKTELMFWCQQEVWLKLLGNPVIFSYNGHCVYPWTMIIPPKEVDFFH